MSCVYCAPKSRIRMRCSWISAPGAAPSLAATLSGSGDAVIRRLLGDRDIVHVALAHAGSGDAHEHRPGAHLLNAVAARVTHGSAQTTGELVENRDQTTLV